MIDSNARHYRGLHAAAWRRLRRILGVGHNATRPEVLIGAAHRIANLEAEITKLRTTDTVIVTADGEDISTGDAQERWEALEGELAKLRTDATQERWLNPALCEARRLLEKNDRLLEEMGKLRAAAQDYIEGNNMNLIRLMEPED